MKPHIGLLVLIVFVHGCSRNSNLKGRVENTLTGLPVPGLTVVARPSSMSKDREELIARATSDSNGVFLLTALSPKFTYQITVDNPGYIVDPLLAAPPEGSEMKELDNPLRVCPLPSEPGFCVWQGEKWIILRNNAVFEVQQTGIRPTMAFNTVLDVSYPTKSGKPAVFITKMNSGYYTSTTDVLDGYTSAIVEISPAITVTAPAVFSFLGLDPKEYELMPMYYYPEAVIYDPDPNGYPGKFRITEGYHLGLERVYGEGKCCRYLELQRVMTVKPVNELFTRRLGQLSFGEFPFSKRGYYAIVPAGNGICTKARGFKNC